jgi:capsid protein
MFYWKESGDLHLPVSEQIFEASVLVKARAQAALAQFVTTDTGETTPAQGSVAQLSRNQQISPVVFS